MAEVKNSFLQSKMNKDLDDRLIPNGEYRNALNISVGKSEREDVGALEAVLGNTFMVDTSNPNLICIGGVADNQNNRVFQFWTDYTDPNPGELTPPSNSSNYDMRITVYDAVTSPGILTTIVSGKFLNFATNNSFRIYGVNVLENLLFWTDNRNQPRKINITSAISDPTYYTDEAQISVAKYSPVFPISVYSKVNVTTIGSTTNPTPIATNITVSNANAALLRTGMQLITNLGTTAATINDYAVITNIVTGISNSVITISWFTSIPAASSLHFFGSTMSDKSDDPNWPGDPNYSKDKYLRFSYRYRFDDGEYSLMAPFTQILFIPNQNGYFLNGDENSAYRSTIVSWMENYINNIVLNIELPDAGNNVNKSYKITSLDILYKESDAVAVKVLETISVDQIAEVAKSNNLYSYTYKSQKPYKTLPSSQTVRVYDRVPIRARAQEIIGNRVVYGNFINQNTPPASINYNLAIIDKSDVFTSWAEYPNHTLKQNRNYQAGIILADKFGRQSSVILSSNDLLTESDGVSYKGSTIYSPYFNNKSNMKSWRGNTLAMIINSPIVSNRIEGLGTPGLYATISGAVAGSSNGFQISTGVVSSNSYTFTLSTGASQINVPTVGNYLRGKYKDYVKVTNVTPAPTVTPSGSYTVTASGPISEIYNSNISNIPDIKFSYNINPLGWYSYKIVVRQQQQDYYNVYLPGILNGYPLNQTYDTTLEPTIFPPTELNKTAHVVLLNDNINKVPRDLSEVGPDQKQYRSSVKLFGRVENFLTTDVVPVTSNRQYYPSKKADVVSTIATSNELDFLITNTTDNPNGTASNNFYQLNTSPLVARISTVNKIGQIATTATGTPAPPDVTKTMNPYLSVYETTPDVSLLDLFWESSTAGLISDINIDVLTGSDIVVGFSNFNFEFNEFQRYNSAGTPVQYGSEYSPYIVDYFEPINSTGVASTTVTNIIMTVVDGDGNDRSANFELFKETVGDDIGKYSIKIKNQFIYLKDSDKKESYTFKFDIKDTVGDTVIFKTGSLTNSDPRITFPITTTFEIPELIVGPVLTCVGNNGSNPIVNTQGLRWSILNTSTLGWETYFAIDQVTGVINLINDDVPPGVDFNFTLQVRLTDAYDFTNNANSIGSKYDDISLTFTYNLDTSSFYCGDWTSTLGYGGSPYNNLIDGTFNFWKYFKAGEKVDVVNTNVNLVSYTTYPFSGETSWIPAAGTGKLYFNSIDYSASLFANANQDDFFQENPYPAYELFISGAIVTTLGRVIPINIIETATTPTPSEFGSSGNDSCTLYIPTTDKSWKLTNTNTSSSIAWQALLASGDTIVGSTLSPGSFVGSATYGGSYSCIVENSLTFASGGVAIYAEC